MKSIDGVHGVLPGFAGLEGCLIGRSLTHADPTAVHED